MENKYINPWLKIPAIDYEGHMAAPNVLQTEFLSKLFYNILHEVLPTKILVLGCTTGNGLEHVDMNVTETVVGVDINPEYLSIAEERYKHYADKIKFINYDVCTVNFDEQKFDLIHAALIFEYVDYAKCLENVVGYLSDEGTLTVLLQLPGNSSQPAVSQTEFKKLELLTPLLKLVEPEDFKKSGEINGLCEKRKTIITLETGKSFYLGYYSKS